MVKMLRYHHCRDLEAVVCGEVKGNPDYYDKDLKYAYDWLAEQVGFDLIFLAVGNTYDDLLMTGYDHNWTRIIGSKIVGENRNGYIQKNILRKKGEYLNEILFSYENIEGVFTDHDAWHITLAGPEHMTPYYERLLFKPSYTKSKWLWYAKKNPHSVQLVVPKLNLAEADRIWCRNKKTKKYLEDLGFSNVEVQRIKVVER
ncbi:hypothetical protein ACFL1H_02275 [Nanoarchaeota archaeon]